MPSAAQAVLELVGFAPGAARPAGARHAEGPSFEEYIRIIARGGAPNAASADATQTTPALSAANASAAQSAAAAAPPFALTIAAMPAAMAPVSSPGANVAPAGQLPVAPTRVLTHARSGDIASLAAQPPAAPASAPAPGAAAPEPQLATAPAQSSVRRGDVTPAIPNQRTAATPASAASQAAALAPARTRETSSNLVPQPQPDASPAAQSEVAVAATSATPAATRPVQPGRTAAAPNTPKPVHALTDSAPALAPAQVVASPQVVIALAQSAALAPQATIQPAGSRNTDAAPTQTLPAAPTAPVSPRAQREFAPAKTASPAIEFRPEGRPGARSAAAHQSAEKTVNNPLQFMSVAADAAPLKLASGADVSTPPQHFLTPAPAASSHVQHALVTEHALRSAPPAAQVAHEILRRFDGDSTRFELRLDPPELGRIEVRLEVTRDHRVTAVVAADNAQALSELTRNARDLEQTLQSAGLELSENGLSFDLRRGGDETADGDSGRAAGAGGAMNDDQPGETVLARPIGFERWRGVRLDLMV